MTKNETRLCWSCDGTIPFHFTECPYCATSLEKKNENVAAFASLQPPPFSGGMTQGEPPTPPAPYSFNVSQEEWNQALVHEKNESQDAENSGTNEMAAFLLLLPGVVFLLFGLGLFFFSKNGSLTLKWDNDFAYFYLIGALPLLFLGWRTFR